MAWFVLAGICMGVAVYVAVAGVILYLGPDYKDACASDDAFMGS